MTRLLALLLLVSGCSEGAPPPPQPRSPCAEQRFEGSSFVVCDPGKGEIRLFAANRDAAVRRFADLPVDPAEVAFAMNAGMFDDDGRPIGLASVDGVQIHALNRRDGYGNFHLKPNGVLSVTADGTARIDDSADLPDFDEPPLLQTQSGPLLVKRGVLHRRIKPDGDSRYVRNGVGVRDGHPLFAISLDAVSLGKFARFFRDRLKTPDALYFDGSVSSLWDPANGRMDNFAELGPIIVALRPVEPAGPGGTRR